jgi:hypothetical protein
MRDLGKLTGFCPVVKHNIYNVTAKESKNIAKTISPHSCININAYYNPKLAPNKTIRADGQWARKKPASRSIVSEVSRNRSCPTYL